MIIENTEQVKELLKTKYITYKNAAKQLNVDYKYLSVTINGYEGYRSVTKALTKAGIPLVIQQSREEAGLNPSDRKNRKARSGSEVEGRGKRVAA